MEFSEPYEVTIKMHSGGTLHLALSDRDKILVIQDFLAALDDFEKKSKPIDIWKLKLDSAQPDPCAVCGLSTRYCCHTTHGAYYEAMSLARKNYTNRSENEAPTAEFGR